MMATIIFFAFTAQGATVGDAVTTVPYLTPTPTLSHAIGRDAIIQGDFA